MLTSSSAVSTWDWTWPGRLSKPLNESLNVSKALLVVSRAGLTMNRYTAPRITTVVMILISGLITVPAPTM